MFLRKRVKFGKDLQLWKRVIRAFVNGVRMNGLFLQELQVHDYVLIMASRSGGWEVNLSTKRK